MQAVVPWCGVTLPLEHSYAQLPERFYARLSAKPGPLPQMIAVNAELARTLGIDPDSLKSPEALALLGGRSYPETLQPIAMAYAGHQFGGFSPQLGDGRALLLGEIVNTAGQRYDVHIKGSGRTPYSRNGDGKAALGPVLREYLVSEAMHQLGVPTTRALAALSTGETVHREEAFPGGLIVRVAASHIRVGTFEYFSARGDQEAVLMLTNYAIARHAPHLLNEAEPAKLWLEWVIAKQAQLIAQWLSLGFIHGVMNTDNCAVSGETIDYGPCAFMDEFHPQCVFSAIDQQARYAWGNQPSIGHWNMTRFAETLLPLLSNDSQHALEIAQSALATFGEIFHRHYLRLFRAKFGISAGATDDDGAAWIKSSLGMMADQRMDFTRFFRALTRHAEDAENRNIAAQFSSHTIAQQWLDDWKSKHNPALIEEMKQHNPVRIPRNHRIEAVIQAAYLGDFSPLEEAIMALRNPYQEIEEFRHWENAPLAHERVWQTFCGT